MKDVPQVKQASNANTKTTAAIAEGVLLIATQIASATSTPHMPKACEINNLRRPTRSMVYHVTNEAVMYQTCKRAPRRRDSCSDMPRLDWNRVGA